MIGRRRAREIVLQLLFQNEFRSSQTRTSELEFIANRMRGDDKLIVFAQNLLTGIRDRESEIDQILSGIATNWKLTRMSITDRSALRLGAYEILFTETPKAVVINEAIELAKRFGNADSGSFVNGILDRLQPNSVKTDKAPSKKKTREDQPTLTNSGLAKSISSDAD
jgi:N utilization substance protein B